MAYSKTLVVFYSRTGMTKKAAEAIGKELGATIEEVFDLKNRKGFFGSLSAGKDALRKKLATIESPTRNPADYDLVVLGTPVWAWNMCGTIRTYAERYKDAFRAVAFFCTMGGSGSQSTFQSLGSICGRTPVATLALTEKELRKDIYQEKVREFAATLRK